MGRWHRLMDMKQIIVLTAALVLVGQTVAVGKKFIADPILSANIRAVPEKPQGTNRSAKAEQGKNPPTYTNVKYGEHERNVFDIWLADSAKLTPLAIYIHGGGFRGGSKETLHLNQSNIGLEFRNQQVLNELLEAGISVASINYRYLSVDTPLPASHHDAKRALQFIRSKATEWNLDKSRVGAFGGSAGAQICMWLAFSDDMAKPKDTDPIERESTRLTCVATTGGQTTLGLDFWQDKIASLLGPETNAISLFPTLDNEKDPQKARIARWGAKTMEQANKRAARYSALSLVSKDDPPIFMSYGMPPTAKPPTDPSRIRGWLTHHVNLGIALKERSDILKHEAHLKYPRAEIKYQSQISFLLDKLLKK